MSHAITCLWLFALVQLVALVIVSVVQHFNMANLLKSENEVRGMLVDLITRKIAESSLEHTVCYILLIAHCIICQTSGLSY